MDALPWLYGATDHLWSFYASTHFLAPPPPPPPPPTPVVLGATQATATPLTPGTTYIATIAPGGIGWGYIPKVTGVGVSTVVSPPTPLAIGTAMYGGNHLLGGVAEGAPITGPGAIVIPGGMHTGPESIMSAANVGFVPNTTTFSIT
jgi:hypothetical protein